MESRRRWWWQRSLARFALRRGPSAEWNWFLFPFLTRPWKGRSSRVTSAVNRGLRKWGRSVWPYVLFHTTASPQRLKPRFCADLTARLEAAPFQICSSAFCSTSGTRGLPGSAPDHPQLRAGFAFRRRPSAERDFPLCRERRENDGSPAELGLFRQTRSATLP